ncbi:MAG: YicC family protein [Gammaproteobacteria bacterium]|nr:YicC family protein [Gammaproteobacteria bacterium]
MIKSMTAYAREELKRDYGVISWELRSVNHRYLEPFIRLPENYRAMEPGVRESLKHMLSRGKVECAFSVASGGGQSDKLIVDKNAVQQLAALCADVGVAFKDLSDISPLEVLKWPGVLDTPTPDVEKISQDGLELLVKTINELVVTREREGAKLREALEERLIAMHEIVGQVRQRMPDILAAVRARLLSRFEELSVQIDNDRLEQEMIVLTQKSDVEEELKRLEMHISEVQRILASDDDKPTGRQLDFLMQELNREANTLCSKSMDGDTTKAGIDLKVYIEQMREQIQNIE